MQSNKYYSLFWTCRIVIIGSYSKIGYSSTKNINNCKKPNRIFPLIIILRDFRKTNRQINCGSDTEYKYHQYFRDRLLMTKGIMQKTWHFIFCWMILFHYFKYFISFIFYEFLLIVFFIYIIIVVKI